MDTLNKDILKQIEEHLVAGFEAHLAFSTVRTETFVPYFLGRTPLIQDRFSGDGSVFRHLASDGAKATVFEKATGHIFTALGKFCGF